MTNSITFMRKVEIDPLQDRIVKLNENFDVLMDLYNYLKYTKYNNISIVENEGERKLRILCDNPSDIVNSFSNEIPIRYSNIRYTISKGCVDIFTV